MKVELVGKTIGIGKYQNLSDEEIIAAIARHGAIKEDNGKLVRYLMDNAHWSPLDMVNYIFEVETSLSIGRQLLRHSSIKPQEFSGRYAEVIGVEPIEYRLQAEKNRQSSTDVIGEVFQEDKEFEIDVNQYFESSRHEDYLHEVAVHLDKTLELYKRGLALGIAKECARMILPNASTTILTFNGTLRSWLALLNVRCDNHAQKECRVIANLVGEELEKHLPNVFSVIDWRKGMFM